MADWREAIARGQLSLEGQRLQQQQWEHSPEYLDMINRDRTAQELRERTWAKQRGVDPASQQIAVLREKAALDASLFEKRYTAKQQTEISHWKSVPQKAASSGLYDADQLRRITDFAKMREMGVLPNDMPRLSKEAPGRGDGESWEQNGVLFWNDNGTKRQVDFNKTPQGVSQKQELEALKEKKKLDTSLEVEKRKFRANLATRQVTTNLGEKRYMTPEEVDEAYNRAYPSEEYTERQRVAKMRQDAGVGALSAQPQDKIAAAIQAAQSGDVGAQKALQKRGIPWQ